MKLDLHDFFDGIKESAVFEIFRGLGYPRLLSFELARLCTRLVDDDRRGWRMAGAPYMKLPQGALPQGAPTSGALANAAMLGVDAKIAAIAEHRGLVYTRYSDDLVFSTSGDFSRRGASALAGEVSGVLSTMRLQIHRRKTRVVPPGARKIVLGLLILEDRVALPRAFKRRIEVHVRGVRRYGLVEHARHRRFDSVLSMIEHIDGCIAYANGVDEPFAERSQAEWQSALAEAGYPGPRHR